MIRIPISKPHDEGQIADLLAGLPALAPVDGVATWRIEAGAVIVPEQQTQDVNGVWIPDGTANRALVTTIQGIIDMYVKTLPVVKPTLRELLAALPATPTTRELRAFIVAVTERLEG